MQGEFGNLDQVQVSPLDTITLAVYDFQVPVNMLLAILESDLDALAVGQRVFAKNIFFPFIRGVRRNVKLVNLDAGGVVQQKVLLAGPSKYGGGHEQGDHGPRQRNF